MEALRGSEGEGEERDSEGEGEERESEGEEKGEEDIDPADRLQHELFPELACSDEDDDDCDWLVTNLDDYSEVDQALSHMLVWPIPMFQEFQFQFQYSHTSVHDPGS